MCVDVEDHRAAGSAVPAAVPRGRLTSKRWSGEIGSYGRRGMSDDRIGLGVVIEQLRAELAALNAVAGDKDLRFALDNVEVELHVGVTREAGASAVAKFWVLELGGEGKYAHERTQTIKLTLKPRLEGLPAGHEVPVGRGGAAGDTGERR